LASVLNIAWSSEFIIREQESYIHAFTDRAGPLKKLSHFHVIELAPLTGTIQFIPDAMSKVELNFKPSLFTVDSLSATQQYPEIWDKPIKESAANGTKKNMLSKKLLTEATYPNIQVTIELPSLSVETGIKIDVDFTTHINIKDNEFEFSLPGTLLREEETLTVESEFQLTHKQLGLKPFKAAGGAIAVGKTISFKVFVEANLVIGSSDK
jgi:hypothetical protein